MQTPPKYQGLDELVRTWLCRKTGRWGVTDIPEISAAVGTTVGLARPENQDRAVILRYTDPAPRGRWFVASVVCEGRIDMVDGGQCADIAITTFARSLLESEAHTPVEGMREALMRANSAVFRTYKGRGGTTLTALLFPARKIRWITVGDTKLYEYPTGGRMEQVSDTIAGELARLHGMKLESFSTRPAQYVGMGEGLQPRMCQVVSHWADPNFLMSTGGARPMGEAILTMLSSPAPSPYTLVQRILNVSNWPSGEDNSSVICISMRAACPRSRLGKPTLEVWDSFGKLEVILAGRQPAE